jgi:hypothetical protein
VDPDPDPLLLRKSGSAGNQTRTSPGTLATIPQGRTERGPFSLVSTTEELLERKSSGSGLEILEYGRRDPSR